MDLADAGEQPFVHDDAGRSRALARWYYADADTSKVLQISSTPKRPRSSSM